MSARAGEASTSPATFLKAPLRSRTVGFPESGSGLGSARHLSKAWPAHRCGSSSADPHTPLAPMVCQPPSRENSRQTRVRPDGRRVVHRLVGFPPGLDVRRHDRLGGRLDRVVPVMSFRACVSLATEYPGLLCPRGALSRGGTASRAAWEGITPPSSLLRAHAPDRNPPRASDSSLCAWSLQVAVSPCWETALPDVISATLAQVPGPIPRRAPWLRLSVPSPGTPVSPHGKRVRRADLPPHGNFGGEPYIEAAVIRLPSGSYTRSAPRLLRPQRHLAPGRRAFHTTQNPAGYPVRAVASLHVRHGQLTWLDSHQLGRSLVGCSFPHTAYR